MNIPNFFFPLRSMKKKIGTLRRSGVSKVSPTDVIRPLEWFFGLKRLLDIFAKKIHETKMARVSLDRSVILKFLTSSR